MIYITHEEDTSLKVKWVKNVWETKLEDAEERYKKFIIQTAKDKFHIVINPNWLNIMNYEDHHNLLEKNDYNQRQKSWNKFLKEWSFDKFMEEIIEAKKVDFKNIYI